MPIYEFYCAPCHRVYSFLSRSIDTATVPACPRCGARDLRRKASAFAISKNRPEKEGGDDGMPDLDEERLDKAMDALASEMDGVDENDPRQAAHVMRRLFEATGMPVGAGMEEALRRMESGEDPEKIEEEMGDALEDDPLGGAAGAAGAAGGGVGAARGAGAAGDAREARLRELRRRMRAPEVDPKLYDM